MIGTAWDGAVLVEIDTIGERLRGVGPFLAPRFVRAAPHDVVFTDPRYRVRVVWHSRSSFTLSYEDDDRWISAPLEADGSPAEVYLGREPRWDGPICSVLAPDERLMLRNRVSAAMSAIGWVVRLDP